MSFCLFNFKISKAQFSSRLNPSGAISPQGPYEDKKIERDHSGFPSQHGSKSKTKGSQYHFFNPYAFKIYSMCIDKNFQFVFYRKSSKMINFGPGTREFWRKITFFLSKIADFGPKIREFWLRFNFFGKNLQFWTIFLKKSNF